MGRLLIISFSPIEKDPRVRRQLALLKDEFELVVAGYGDFQLPGVSMVTLPAQGSSIGRRAVKAGQLFIGAFAQYYWRRQDVVTAVRNLIGKKFELVLANDVEALPLALKIANGAPVILDAHEYSPNEFSGWEWSLFFWRYKTWLCEKYLERAYAVCTVSRGIAEEYERNFGVRCSIVMNAAEYRDLQPSEVQEGRIRLIHHGAINRSRQIERMIDLMDFLDERFSLDLMLVNNDAKYFGELRERAGRNPRIRFVEPVPFQEILSVLNRYDIGVYLLPFSNFNNRHALPNKFFEFVQGRLGIAI
ncbi:glycosyltransferase [Tepidimonas taiwanensis]|nr:glycosyltransferase [Tepidimonas taiwanensis]UBQ06148.1 glycosyltransferase [Tepidimonas taiwanensis]